MTATGTEFSNPEGMYLDTVVVVVVDELCCYFLYLFDLELGFFFSGRGSVWVFSFGLLFRPVQHHILYPKTFLLLFFSFFFFSSPSNSFRVRLEVAY